MKNSRVFAVIEPGISDGFRIDRHGHVFTSAGDGIQVYSEAGKRLGKIFVPEAVSNCVFGGPTGERLFTKWEFAPLIEREMVDVIQPDICHAGGILELKKIAAMAEAHYIKVAPHNPNGPVATAASVANLALLGGASLTQKGNKAEGITWETLPKSVG